MSSLLWDLPLIGNLLRIQSRIERYSPEQQRQFVKDLKDKVGLGDDVNFNEQAFNKYVELRRHDFSGFFKKPKEPETLTEEQTTLAKKLSAEGEQPAAVRKAITQAIKLTDDTKIAKEQYTDSVEAFKTLLSGVPEQYSARAVIGSLTQYRNTAVKAIEEQQKTEVTNLTNALADPATKEALRVSLGIGPTSEVKGITAAEALANADELKAKSADAARLEELRVSLGIGPTSAVPGTTAEQATANAKELKSAMENPVRQEQLRQKLGIGPTNEVAGTTPEQAAANVEKLKSATDNILADLQNGHKKQLQYFTDNTNKSINELHNQAQTKAAEIAFIHYLSTLNNVTSANIEAFRQQRQSKGEPGLEKEKGEPGLEIETAAKVHMAEDRIYLSGITLKQIGDITTESGKVLKYDEKTDSYSMDMTRHIFSPLYYTDPRNNPLADATMIAHAIKAGGFKTITMEATYKDQHIADERGREAFEACINAGFPPEKISVVVNGKTYSTNPKDGATAMSELFKEKHSEQYSALLGKSKIIVQGHESNAALIGEATKGAESDSPESREKVTTFIDTAAKSAATSRASKEALAASKADAAKTAAATTVDPTPAVTTAATR